MNNSTPAFPCKNYPKVEEQFGMTIRDYFAAKAMQAKIQTSSSPAWILSKDDEALLAEASYSMADAMIAQRNRK